MTKNELEASLREAKASSEYAIWTITISNSLIGYYEGFYCDIVTYAMNLPCMKFNKYVESTVLRISKLNVHKVSA